jgi:hypothetical protein
LLDFTLLIALMLVVPSAWADTRPAPADDEPSDVATVWFDTLYDVVKSEAAGFPVAARIYGVSAVALYEAIVPGTLAHRSLVGQLDRLASVPQPTADLEYHWPTVANAALARTIRGLFPSLQPESVQAINAVERRFTAQFHAEVEEKASQRSVTQGQRVADAILAWAATDGFSRVNNCPYVPEHAPGVWEPTPPAFTPDPDSAFYAAALEVYHTGRTLTDEQRTTAQYWNDGVGVTGTSSGHWMAIVGQIARNDDLSLAAAAEAYAKLGIAVADVFITIFHAKYRYNLLRPVTYIQDHIDDSWLPLIVTPPNPAYIWGEI